MVAEFRHHACLKGQVTKKAKLAVSQRLFQPIEANCLTLILKVKEIIDCRAISEKEKNCQSHFLFESSCCIF